MSAAKKSTAENFSTSCILCPEALFNNLFRFLFTILFVFLKQNVCLWILT